MEGSTEGHLLVQGRGAKGRELGRVTVMVKSPQERATGLVPRVTERVSEEYLGMVAMAKRRDVGRGGR
eukprot:scaffold3675_cov112-Amphora_coffeaeformis.AAC.3